jgi:hypothetical protein
MKNGFWILLILPLAFLAGCGKSSRRAMDSVEENNRSGSVVDNSASGRKSRTSRDVNDSRSGTSKPFQIRQVATLKGKNSAKSRAFNIVAREWKVEWKVRNRPGADMGKSEFLLELCDLGGRTRRIAGDADLAPTTDARPGGIKRGAERKPADQAARNSRNNRRTEDADDGDVSVRNRRGDASSGSCTVVTNISEAEEDYMAFTGKGTYYLKVKTNMVYEIQVKELRMLEE